MHEGLDMPRTSPRAGHSWGGILAIEYALKYPQHPVPGGLEHDVEHPGLATVRARDVLMPRMDPAALKEISRWSREPNYVTRYEELLLPYYSAARPAHARVAVAEPGAAGIVQTNKAVYVPMQGPAKWAPAAILLEWDHLPTWKIGSAHPGDRRGHDTMDPTFMQMMSRKFPRGDYLYLPNGSHMAMYDDQQAYFAACSAGCARSTRALRAHRAGVRQAQGQGTHAARWRRVAGPARPPAEEIELDEHRGADHVGLQRIRQSACRGERAAGREDVVDETTRAGGGASACTCNASSPYSSA